MFKVKKIKFIFRDQFSNYRQIFLSKKVNVICNTPLFPEIEPNPLSFSSSLQSQLSPLSPSL